MIRSRAPPVAKTTCTLAKSSAIQQFDEVGVKVLLLDLNVAFLILVNIVLSETRQVQRL